MSRWLPALLLLLLAVPFHPSWLDDESARRGLLQVAAGVLLVGSWRWLPSRPGLVAWLWTALVAWHLIRTFGTEVPSAGLRRSAHLVALWAVLAWARRTEVADWLRAGVPVAIAVSAVGLVQALGLPRELNAVLLESHGGDPGRWTWLELWLHDLLLYGAPDDAVATLGNRNVASEVVAVAGAACAALLAHERAHRRGGRVLAWTGLALGMAYLLANGSRSGLVALPVAVVLLFARRGLGARRRTHVLAALLAGLGIGLLVHLARPEPEAAAAAPSAEVVAVSRPSTVRVRLEMWHGAAEMAAARPVLGHGSGQFAVRYPLYRSQQEIELSTWGTYRDEEGAPLAGTLQEGPRAFRAAPRSAHHDPLEMLVETGGVGLLLLAAFAVAVAAGPCRREPAVQAPLAAFVLLMLVRSPLGNAPAAALALGLAGAAAGPLRAHRAPAWLRAGAAALGALVLAAGASTWLGQTLGARYVRDLEFPRPEFPRVEVLSEAVAVDPFEPNLRALRLQEALRAGRGRLAAEDAAALGALSPHGVAALLLRARAAQQQGDLRGAATLVERALEIDPRDPEAALQLASLQLERGRLDAVVRALYHDPHPRLRARLGGLFAEFEGIASERAAASRAAGLPELAAAFESAAALYRFERRLQRAVTALRGGHGVDIDLSLRDLLEDELAAGDPRPWVLLAVWQMQRGQPAAAAELAGRLRGTELHRWQRHALGGIEDALLVLPPWRKILESE